MRRSRSLSDQPVPCRKQQFKGYEVDNEFMDYQLRMLANWKLAEQATRYLKCSSKIKCGMHDLTPPVYGLVLYSPNLYQEVIDSIPDSHAIELET